MSLLPIFVSVFTGLSARAQSTQTVAALAYCEFLVRETVAAEAVRLGKPIPRYQLSEPMQKAQSICFGPDDHRACYTKTIPNTFVMISSVFEAEDHHGYLPGSGFRVVVYVSGPECVFKTPKIGWGDQPIAKEIR